jgi:hypothetical protein
VKRKTPHLFDPLERAGQIGFFLKYPHIKKETSPDPPDSIERTQRRCPVVGQSRI